MPEAVIVDAIRTPIGRAVKGSLRGMRADELAAVPIRELIARNPDVDFSQTTDVLMGAAYGVGEQGYNVGRTASLLAGMDHHVPACTVNRFCASSLMTIRMAFHAIRAGEGEQYIAAGVEAVSRAGRVPAGPDTRNPRLNGSEGSLYDVYIPMGMTAENVAERCSVTREQQDEWAVISQQRAVAARDSGHFDAEIVPVTVPAHAEPAADGSEQPVEVAETVVSRDDGPRAGTTMEVLAKLKPVFKPDGTVTAGNACPLNDGAAAVLVMSEERASRLGLEPLARIIGSTVAAIRPEIMGLGPIPAIEKLVQETGVAIDQVEEKLNPFGGAIALGHPFGMTGARIMTTLLNGLRAKGGRYGIESMCVAGGMGQAMLVERL
jgi:acetyl-CoA C-acetyltransferase